LHLTSASALVLANSAAVVILLHSPLSEGARSPQSGLWGRPVEKKKIKKKVEAYPSNLWKFARKGRSGKLGSEDAEIEEMFHFKYF
jgi:hypothetical protein